MCLHVYNECFCAVQYIWKWGCYPSFIHASHSKCTDWHRDSKERSLRVWELEKSLINKVALHQEGVGGDQSLGNCQWQERNTKEMCGWLMAPGIGRRNKTNKKLLDHGGICLKHFQRCAICKPQHAAEAICRRFLSPGHAAMLWAGRCVLLLNGSAWATAGGGRRGAELST